jgi:hypothetical protein
VGTKDIRFQKWVIKKLAMNTIPIDNNITGKVPIFVAKRGKFEIGDITESKYISKNEYPYYPVSPSFKEIFYIPHFSISLILANFHLKR